MSCKLFGVTDIIIQILKPKGVLTLSPVAPYLTEARSSLSPSPPSGQHCHCSSLDLSTFTSCTHIITSAQSQHNREQHRVHDFTDFFCGLFRVVLVIDCPLTVLDLLIMQGGRGFCQYEAQRQRECAVLENTQTKWTLGVKRAQTQYRLPSVSAP